MCLLWEESCFPFSSKGHFHLPIYKCEEGLRVESETNIHYNVAISDNNHKYILCRRSSLHVQAYNVLIISMIQELMHKICNEFYIVSMCRETETRLPPFNAMQPVYDSATTVRCKMKLMWNTTVFVLICMILHYINPLPFLDQLEWISERVLILIALWQKCKIQYVNKLKHGLLQTTGQCVLI